MQSEAEKVIQINIMLNTEYFSSGNKRFQCCQQLQGVGLKLKTTKVAATCRNFL